MASDAQKQKRLDALEASIASGVRKIEYDGEMQEFRTLREMRSIRDELKAELQPAARARPDRRVAQYDRGFN